MLSWQEVDAYARQIEGISDPWEARARSENLLSGQEAVLPNFSRYPQLSNEAQIEEAIAEAFADYADKKAPVSAIQSIIAKVKRLTGEVFNWFNV